MNDNDAHAFYAPYRPTIWERLGFGMAHVNAVKLGAIREDWACEGLFIVEGRINLTWVERLRVLVSGKISTQTAVKTDVPIGRSASIGAAKIMPPGAK